MTYYAVIDTNVLVAALLSKHEDAATVQVLSRLFSGAFIPLFDTEILEEYNAVLRRKKFHFTESAVETLIHVIQKYGENVSAAPTGAILPDPKDLPFYEVVLERKEDNAFLVTGNMKHFPKEPFIVTAREFLDILEHG